MKTLNTRDLTALSFMTLALFLGAGNIIFPPLYGLQYGDKAWWFAAGFLVTAVGMPVLTIIALARVNGTIEVLSKPIGKVASICFAVTCYLAVGPLFATPRTATVSYEMGVLPFIGSHLTPQQGLLAYSIAYFSVTLVLSFFPGRLLDTVGKVLAPVKVLAIAVLGLSAFLAVSAITGEGPAYQTLPSAAFNEGVSNGYLTMDTLGALVFGIVIVRAIQSRGVTSPQLITRYAILAGVMAGIGLSLVYISLFRLGIDSQHFAADATNGAQVLRAFVHHVFGDLGDALLAFLIIIACLVTSVGLTCACAEYFSQLLKCSERTVVVVLAVFAAVVSNLGLTQLIHISGPVLYGLGPICVTLVFLQLAKRWWLSDRLVIAPCMVMALIFGSFELLSEAHVLPEGLKALLSRLPFSDAGLGWTLPVLATLVVMIVIDRTRGVSERI